MRVIKATYNYEELSYPEGYVCKYCGHTKDKDSVCCGKSYKGKIHPHFCCTRELGHTGNHVACGEIDHEFLIWKD